ncbi:YwqJ-related putative deaminase [Solwaraspora sp. WMMD406]|uniref:YwqJ-related putative deaminase n=1 Tax=Solwaraspora sp. WMMD406 TaxID=3016095 RepID=UPI002415DE35|nr:YwqJ-related putative deaminase [Solwaraspora sp. WMMD406]MDG4762760.1 YwqJ-related putative deaminase [Solwaraspora sp. WMMD406]
MTEARMLPLAAGALLIGGTVHTHTSVRGDQRPRLHPLVARFLDDLPNGQRERFTGWCAEPVLLSDRLYAAESDGGAAALTPTAARAALWGARVRLTRIREPGDPVHGTALVPCRSCAALLEWFGVEVLE